MTRNRDIREVVWPENRDETFLKWIAEDAALLYDSGFSTAEVRSMLIALEYVQIWSANPRWLFPIRSLPKGYRWRDGQKFSQSRGRKSDGYSYIFLPVGKDLYIKGLIVAGTKVDDYPASKIRRYKELTCVEVLRKFPELPGLNSAMQSFWKSQGLTLGYTVPCLRPFRQQVPDSKHKKPP